MTDIFKSSKFISSILVNNEYLKSFVKRYINSTEFYVFGYNLTDSRNVPLPNFNINKFHENISQNASKSS